MRLTPEELKKLTKELISSLEQKKFSVHTNRYGNILYVDRFGIRCCPAILNSTEDGKQGYAYIQLVTNPYSEKDLGHYYKPTTNKSTSKLIDKNYAVDKYSGKDVHIDMHNYKQVINTFINDLIKDYRGTVQTEDLNIDPVDDTGGCIWKPRFRVWNISKDNISLKSSIYPYINFFNFFTANDYLMERGWLVNMEVTGSAHFLGLAIGNDDGNYPETYCPIGYIDYEST